MMPFRYRFWNKLMLLMCRLGLNSYVDLDTGRSVYAPFQRPPQHALPAPDDDILEGEVK